MATILIADDDDVFRERMARALRERMYTVVTARDCTEAITAARAQRFSYAVVDLRMPGPSGLDLLSALKKQDATMRIVVLTGYGNIASAVEAMRRGAHSYLAKPADADDLLRAIVRDDSEQDAPSMKGGAPPPSLARAEWEHVQRVLADCGGNVSETARRLSITRRTLQLKLKRGPPQVDDPR